MVIARPRGNLPTRAEPQAHHLTFDLRFLTVPKERMTVPVPGPQAQNSLEEMR